MYGGPETIEYLQETQKPFPWLRAIIGGGGLAIAAAVATDGWLGKRHWPQTQNQFIGIHPGTKEASVSFGGLGVTCSNELAQDAQRYLPGVAAHITYSNKEFSIGQLASAFNQKAASMELLHLNGHSWGGPVGLETVRASKHPSLKLGKIVLNCSPFDNNDVRLGRYTRLVELVQWPVGPGTKLLFSFSRSTLERRPFLAAWQQATYDARNGCSADLFLSQIPAMRRINLNAQLESYKPLVGPNTRVLYCRPKDPDADIVVDTPQASERFGNFFERLGVPYEDVQIPDVGHAQSSPTAHFLANRGT